MKIGRIKNKMRSLKVWAESIEDEIRECPLEKPYTYFKIPIFSGLVRGSKAKRSCQVEAIRSVFSTLDTLCSKDLPIEPNCVFAGIICLDNLFENQLLLFRDSNELEMFIAGLVESNLWEPKEVKLSPLIHEEIKKYPKFIYRTYSMEVGEEAGPYDNGEIILLEVSE